MSAKWIRSKQWDEQNIPGWAWPVKVGLRAFSSIPLAVCLLGFVAVYCTMASVPVGLIALAPTYGLYAATLLVFVVLGAGAPVGVMRLAWHPGTSGARALRFAVSVLAAIFLSVISAGLWQMLAWPRLHFDPVTGSGVRLFAEFVQQYESTTLRRMPWLEMSELEFYSWWPLRLVLTLFVINMIVATVRRIEFNLPNLGVLTVHTGIVTIALGSMYYGALKQEGDTLLFAGEPASDGQPTAGLPQSGFYDNMRVVLWVRQEGRLWEQRPIWAPRYNDYNLGAAGTETAMAKVGHEVTTQADGGRKIDHTVREPGDESRLDKDLSFRVIGYASYAEPTKDFVRAERRTGERARPVRFADLVVDQDVQNGTRGREMRAPFYFLPDEPAQRLAQTEVFALEYVRGMSPQRFDDLSTTLPEGVRHALLIEVPGQNGSPAYREVHEARTGSTLEIGETGFRVEVVDLLPRPPFPIITEGFQNADSSVAIVQITSPTESYERWIYHRYPEINQDMLQGVSATGRQARRTADPGIRVSYIDATKLQIYIDEPLDGGPARAIVRRPGVGTARLETGLEQGGVLRDAIPGLHVRLGERWEHAVQVERPAVVPVTSRRNDEIGNHMRSMLAVEVAAADWTRVIWLPFTKYLGAGLGTERDMVLPDGRKVQLAFGRLRYPFPGFMIQLLDFQMVAYDHRGSPRDYQSLIRVVPQQFSDVPMLPIQRAVEQVAGSFRAYEHITKLNAPLQAPFMLNEHRSQFRNTAGLLLSRLNPQQFKFSQAGWDAEGWQQSQLRADRGELRRPYAQFTILGVGNNPGIHIIALGGILMSVGIPWAFYIKPLMMQRRKRRLQAQLAAGTYTKKPAASLMAGAAS
jgi:hypothetical protein